MSLEVVEVFLVQYNLVDKEYQQTWVLLYTFIPDKSYAYLLSVEPSNLVWWNYHIIYWSKRLTVRNRRQS